jgi:lipoyl(octanoyl) transferase
MEYREALELQRQLQRQVIDARVSGEPAPIGYLLLVEHDPPVITVSRRGSARENLIATDAQLAGAGVQVCETDRGGDITYHGPGQLVAYPILDLNAFGLRLHSYMRLLEQVVIDTLAEFGIEGQRDSCATGVWVDATRRAGPSPGPDAPDCQTAPLSKICAMGVRISRWVSMHGLALNVTTNLDHFNLIVPCGLAGRSVTSMERALGDAAPLMGEVKESLSARLSSKLASLRVQHTAG